MISSANDNKGIPTSFVDLSRVYSANIERYSSKTLFYDIATDSIAKSLRALENCVPVVAGFFGSVPGGLIDGVVERG